MRANGNLQDGEVDKAADLSGMLPVIRFVEDKLSSSRARSPDGGRMGLELVHLKKPEGPDQRG